MPGTRIVLGAVGINGGDVARGASETDFKPKGLTRQEMSLHALSAAKGSLSGNGLGGGNNDEKISDLGIIGGIVGIGRKYQRQANHAVHQRICYAG